MQFIAEWNQQAHAFGWSEASFEKILSKCREAQLLKAA